MTGVMQIPMGSLVTVRAGGANKELVRVQISSIVGDRAEPAQVLEAKALAANRRGFSYKLPPLLKDSTLQFTLTDVNGIKSREPVRLVLVALADQPPQVDAHLDRSKGWAHMRQFTLRR